MQQRSLSEQPTPSRKKLLVETLEQRILYSADAGALLPDTLDAPTQAEVRIIEPLSTQQTSTTNQNQTKAQRHEIVFIDESVEDHEVLVNDLLKHSDDRTFEIYTLNHDAGIEQITGILADINDINAIHIISHGDAGQIKVGDSIINNDTFQQFSTQLTKWTDTLDSEADILFYGCNVSATEDGLQLLEKIASATGADVAASDDLTGHSELNGDWELEVSFGDINSELVFSTDVMVNWYGTLEIVAESNETLVNTSTPENQWTTPYGGGNVAMDDAGNYVVVWDDFRNGNFDTYAKVYNADGSVRVDEFIVHTTNSSAQDWSNVSMDNNGNFVVTWSDNRSGNYEVYMRLFDLDGTPLTNETQVSLGAGIEESHAVDFAGDGSFVITWVNYSTNIGDIYFQRFDASGVAQGGNTLANSTTANTQDNPDVAVNGDGSFVISWMSDGQDGNLHGMYFQRFDASGLAQGSETLINQTTSGEQWYGTIDNDASGNFVATWMSNDGNGYGIYARRFDASGTPLGNEFLVNTWTQGDQGSPNVAVNDNGSFVITWHDSSGHDGTGFGVYAQHYDTTGNALGGEIQIAQTTSNDQKNPTVAISGSSSVIVWSGNGTQPGQSDSNGVFLRRFSLTLPNTAPAGTDATISATEDTIYTFNLVDFGFTDTDGNNFDRVYITTLPNQGILKWQGNAFAAGNYIAAVDIANGDLTYEPPANANGTAYTSFTFQVADDGGTLNGGVDTDQSPNTMTINISQVNDAPVLTPYYPTYNTTEGASPITVTVATVIGASVTDVDAGSQSGIAITSFTGASGNIDYSTDNGVTWNSVGILADSSALLLRSSDLLRFTPDNNTGGTMYTTHRAWDQTSGSFGTKVDTSINGGSSAFSSAFDQVTINVTQVNDAGTFGGDVSATTNEDTATSGTVTFTDTADGYTGNTFAINTAAANGTAAIDTAGNWTYTPNANFNGADSFTVQVTDDDGNVETKVIGMAIKAVDDTVLIDPGTGTASETNTAETEENSEENIQTIAFNVENFDEVTSEIKVNLPNYVKTELSKIVNEFIAQDLSTPEYKLLDPQIITKSLRHELSKVMYENIAYQFTLQSQNHSEIELLKIDYMQYDEITEQLLFDSNAASLEITGAVLSAGTLWWALRASGLLASLLTSIPTWRQVDLLAILSDDNAGNAGSSGNTKK